MQPGSCSPSGRTTSGRDRDDRKTQREQIDIAAVVTNLMGPAQGRRGKGSSRKLWWPCPFGTHEDRKPPFSVDPDKRSWHCFGCREHGDEIELVKKLHNASVLEAREYLTGGPNPPRPGEARGGTNTRPTTRARTKPPITPTGLPETDALALVEAATERLRKSDGAGGLANLTGPRCLAQETIRAARPGWTSWIESSKPTGGTFQALGVLIPWFNADWLAFVRIRQPEGRTPKYVESFRNPTCMVCYPGPAMIRCEPRQSSWKANSTPSCLGRNWRH